MHIVSNSISFVIKILCFRRISICFNYRKCDFSNKKFSPYFIQIRHLYLTSNPVQNLATIKGWKSLARDGYKDNTKKEFLSCEEGTDAVPHHILMSQLQDCNTVSEQIKTFCSSVSITSKDVQNRTEFCKFLTEKFNPYFSDYKLNLFGSSINGLGFKGSDVDVSIQTMFSDKEYVRDMKQVPTLDSVIKGEVSTDIVARLPPIFLLRFVRRILRAHCSNVHEPILLIKARCPLLRFYDAKYDVFCDFSCENYASLRNTKLVRLMCCLDERFSVLAKVIRYWGKYGGFVGDIDLFNSYAFSLLVVHFLQLRNPPVLPPIEDLIKKSEYLAHGDVNDDELLFNDLKKFEPSQNTQTVEHLLREFFFHYLTFDFSQMMLPLVSSNIPKADFVPEIAEGSESFEMSTVAIQDPFRLNNASASAKYKSCRRFLNTLIEVCRAYQDENIWHPKSEKWGLCSLFHRTLSDQDILKFHPDSTHTIKLPLKTDVFLLTRILQEGLLFECTESMTEGSQSSLRLNCKVYYNTWVGRDWIYKSCPSSLTDQLEIENWISNQILKNKEENRKQLLFIFSCECFENMCDNKLNVILTFNKSKYPPVIAIFLKEYIPLMCKKLTM